MRYWDEEKRSLLPYKDESEDPASSPGSREGANLVIHRRGGILNGRGGYRDPGGGRGGGGCRGTGTRHAETPSNGTKERVSFD